MRVIRSAPSFAGIVLFILGHFTAAASAQSAPDFTQSVAMLKLLRACHDNKASPRMIDHVFSLPGTRLVIAQQNISRHVSEQQYRQVLQAACNGRIADVKPGESGARAEKGAAGLLQDVAPSLVWGRDHAAELQAALRELRANREIRDAVPLAHKYLPEQVPLRPKLYIVMGGRAGAATIDDQLYFDVLISQWRASQGKTPTVSPHEVVEFFAHETHHLGYGLILEKKRASLHLTPAEDQAWRFLVAIMMEGSATLLINGHERLADLEKQPDIQLYLSKASTLLPEVQSVLQGALGGPLRDETYDKAVSPFLDMGYHATGAVLLAAIQKKRGWDGVRQVMANPRQLLVAYNDCVDDSTVNFRFDPALAERVAAVGAK